MKIPRREFLIRGSAAAVSLPLVALGRGKTRAAAPIPILDIHQHPHFDKRSVKLLMVHQRFHNVTTTVLLPGDGWMYRRMSGNDEAWSHVRMHPDEIVTFCNVDPEREDAVQVLQKHLDKGALGIGEQKFELDADSPQMRRVYDVARDYGVPVLLHFGSKHNHGFERFHRILEAYPQVSFLGHAGTWWSNISRDGKQKGRVHRGGLSDKLLADYPNMYGDLSAGSGLNALSRDKDFAADFVLRHSLKLIWGSDCFCHDGKGATYPPGYCTAQRSLDLLRGYVQDPGILRRITYDNGARLLKLAKRGKQPPPPPTRSSRS